MKVSTQYANEHFDELALAAERGESVEIASDSRPALLLVKKPVDSRGSVRRSRSEILGIFAGKMWISPNFDSPEVNDAIAAEFEDGPVFPIDSL